MAHGIPCKKCGWQEAEHDFMNRARSRELSPEQKKKVVEEFLPEGYDTVQPECKTSLKRCRRYVPEKI